MKARAFNKPAALRDHPEKLAILEFPQLIGPTLVTRDAEAIKRFHAEHRDIILKPLDGMGGMASSASAPTAFNLGSITETLNRHGTTTVMVQRYLPRSCSGDKRILVIAGAPVPLLPWRASRRAARSAATSPPAARAWRSRSRRATARSPRRRAPSPPRAAAAGGPGRDRRLPHRDQRHQPDLLPARSATRPASTSRRRSSTRWRRRWRAA